MLLEKDTRVVEQVIHRRHARLCQLQHETPPMWRLRVRLYQDAAIAHPLG